MTSELRFFDVSRSQVIILDQNVLVMNKSHAVFRVDVNDDKTSQNPTGRSPFDIFAKTFLTNKMLVELNFAFISPVPAVYYGGQASYAHTKMIT